MMPVGHPLSGLLYNQQDLPALCAERPLDWHEYAHMNEFHGNAFIFKQFADLPENEPLPFGIEHAIPYDLREAYAYDLNSHLPCFLSVNEATAQLYSRNGMAAHPVGFSYLYALDLFQKKHAEAPSTSTRSGTIIFPDKSTLLMNTDFNRKSFAQRLMELPAEFHPIVTCIYWKDYLRGNHLPFQQAGIPVVTCGHLRDGLFLLRLHDLCRRFRYSCANDIAGSFALSILSGCHFFHLPGGPVTMEKNQRTETYSHDPSLDGPEKKACLNASPFPPEDPEKQKSLVHNLAGVAHKKNREEIRLFYEESSHKLSRHFLTKTLFLPDLNRLAELFSLRPIGVDHDGWCRKHAAFRIPSAVAATHLTFYIRFPYRTKGYPVLVEVLLDGKLLKKGRLTTRGLRISVCLKREESTAVRLLEFRSSDELQLEEDPRKRSFHVYKIDTVRNPLLSFFKHRR